MAKHQQSRPITTTGSAETSSPANRLLARLPDEDFERLRPDLQTIHAKVRQYFQRQGEAVEHVYFPDGGVASITTTLQQSGMVEAATVGDEGMLGIEAFLSPNGISQSDTLLQVGPATLQRLPVVAFRRELDRGGALRENMGRYAQFLVGHVMQSTACNARHAVQERCCRWLLQTHDRVHGSDFQLSHEFLAVMLGVRRPSVTVVAGTLQQAGLIRYRHGHVTVVDRAGLEAASCECYGAIRQQFERLDL